MRAAASPSDNAPGEDGLAAAFVLDGRGGGRAVGWREIHAWRPEHGTLWLHLDRHNPGAQRWLTDESGIERHITEALLAEGTSPRFTPGEHGDVRPDSFALVVRGVNVSPEAAPEDLVSLRIWADGHRVISLSHRTEAGIASIGAQAALGFFPRDAGDLVAEIVERLTDEIEKVVVALADAADELEDESLAPGGDHLPRRISDIRRRIIAVRRYVIPQRDVVRQLRRDGPPWLGHEHRARLGDAAEETSRLVDDLDTARERATVAQDELSSRLTEQTNRRLYLFTIVAVIFLPLTLLTGLLGSNVAGIPGAENEAAFAVVTGLLIVLGAIEYLVLRRLHAFDR